MVDRLQVFLHGSHLGEVSRSGRELRLAFGEDWVNSSGRQQLSMSLPKTTPTHTGERVSP